VNCKDLFFLSTRGKRQFAAKHCEWKKQKVTMNVQRLESENFLSIISPRAPTNKFFEFMTKTIKNTRNGYHLNSPYWQNYKKTLPKLPQDCFDIAVGMILGDATMYYVSREALIKFEQGVKQKEFLFHLFDMFSRYCFMTEPGIRVEKKTSVKSYWFKTFSFPDFTRLFLLIHEKIDGKWKKTIKERLLLDYLTPKGLAYWIMCDGSLQKNNHTLILHTQSFSLKENLLLTKELNQKFHLNSRVISHKTRYYVIEFPRQDSQRIAALIEDFLIPSMRYKLPNSKNFVNDIV